MKVLTQEGFDQLPVGSLYARFQYGSFSTVHIKGLEGKREYITQLFDAIARCLYLSLQSVNLSTTDENPDFYVVWGITISEPVT